MPPDSDRGKKALNNTEKIFQTFSLVSWGKNSFLGKKLLAISRELLKLG